MNKNKKGSVLSTKVSSKKAWRKRLFDHQVTIMKRIHTNKRNMKKEVVKEVEKQFGDKIHMINSALDGVIALRKIFIDKGFITQEEYNKEKAEMRKRKK